VIGKLPVGDVSPICPLGGVKVAVASAEKAFKEANAADKARDATKAAAAK